MHTPQEPIRFFGSDPIAIWSDESTFSVQVTTKVAARIARASIRQVKYWDETEVVPAVYSPKKFGVGRRWSINNLIQLRVVSMMREVDAPMDACRAASQYIGEMLDEFRLEHIPAYKIIVRHGDPPEVFTATVDENILPILDPPNRPPPLCYIIGIADAIKEVAANFEWEYQEMVRGRTRLE